MRPITIALAAALATATAGAFSIGCQDSGSGSPGAGKVCTQAGYRCSQPDCYTFPRTPGCDDVAPVGGFCPLSHSYCFDPTTSSAYCEPAEHRCGSFKSPAPQGCPSLTLECNEAMVTQCWDIPDETEVVCHDNQECVAIACNDGGVSDGGGDGGSDGGAPADLAKRD